MKFDWIKKTLILGSGAIKIAEAGEFDYSGSQAIKALKEEGIKTVLVNPNVATIQTDPLFADSVYLLPVNPQFVEKVIEKEKPDSILLGFGGQTAINCGVTLAKSGILDKYNVKIIGTPLEGIEATEDRALFKSTMERAGVPTLRSCAVRSFDEAKKVAEEFGYPVMIRVAYNLGGRGSGVAYNEYELEERVRLGVNNSMIGQVLIEEYVGHWKQIEYEVMRDYDDNCVVVCNMENVFGMRIHTGDNVVVAPSQTLNNREYQTLRSAAIRAVRACKIVGECNIQFALDPNSERFCAIEINPRLSRSSALASKATGYPLAYMAAKLSIGYRLSELTNRVTGITTACFEPALDYVVVKFPRWDLVKFDRAIRRIGTQMKSVGEVMAIGRCFEEAIQKAVRMLDIGRLGLIEDGAPQSNSLEELEHALLIPTDQLLFDVMKALKAGIPPDRVSKLACIDKWFLAKLYNLLLVADRLKLSKIDSPELRDLLLEAKRLGFSDKQISTFLKTDELSVRSLRLKMGIRPVVKQIDTLAGEWSAKTNYLYLTYGGDEDDITSSKRNKKIMVLGSGPYRIGSSVEFDWCTMNMVWSLKKNGADEVIVINCNPETVSTDYDMSDRLYFEELTLERVLDIWEMERPHGLVLCVGGQIPNNLALPLAELGVKILGTPAECIDKAEDREKFSRLLEKLQIPQPPWRKFTTVEDAVKFAEEVGYPVLIRPSYVLSGSAMKVCWGRSELQEYLISAAKVSRDHPVVISKFIDGALEVEMDGVADGTRILFGVLFEHIEMAGIHSGDATSVLPPQRVALFTTKNIRCYAESIVRALKITGPFNVQFLVKDGRVYIIECNLRASRSMPFVSKITGINLMDLSAKILLGIKVDTIMLDPMEIPYVGVKVPQFSFMQVEGSDPILGVEMRSTGEVACLGDDLNDALLKAFLSSGLNIPKPGEGVLVSIADEEKDRAVQIVRSLLREGYLIYATEHTAEHMLKAGLNRIKTVYKIKERMKKPNIADLLSERKISLVINVPSTRNACLPTLEDEYLIRRKAIELGIPVITSLDTANAFVNALTTRRDPRLTIRPLEEYYKKLKKF